MCNKNLKYAEIHVIYLNFIILLKFIVFSFCNFLFLYAKFFTTTPKCKIKIFFSMLMNEYIIIEKREEW